jgi:hypothetical protein
MWLAGREQVQAPSDRTLAPIGRAGGVEQDGSSMIGGSIERASPDRWVLTSFWSFSSSGTSSSKFGLSLASDAKMRNAANDKKQIAIDLKIAFHHLIVVSSRVLNR